MGFLRIVCCCVTPQGVSVDSLSNTSTPDVHPWVLWALQSMDSLQSKLSVTVSCPVLSRPVPTVHSSFLCFLLSTDLLCGSRRWLLYR